MKLKLLSVKDTPQVARIHKLYLKEGTLAKLDEAFLKDFYKSTIGEKDIFTVIALENDKVLGFATGAVNLKAVPRTIIPKVLKSIIMATVKKPFIIFKIPKMLFYPSFRQDTKSAEIFCLAVIPGQQGKGIGKSLIDYGRKQFKKSGCDNFIVSVRKDMEANNFYEKIGLEKVKSTKFLGETINFWQGDC